MDLSAALDHGVPPLPATLPVGRKVIAAAGVWGDYGAVVVLSRDDEEDHDLLDDVYLLGRAADGSWQHPYGSSGSVMPEEVLRRPASPPPGWRGEHLLDLSAQLSIVGGRWLTELTVLATTEVTTVEVTYGGESITVPVPPSGLITLPGLIRSVDDVARFRGFDDSGALRGMRSYLPLTESDRRHGWPTESFWTVIE
ncbi:hypothetical protein [Paractinoplanes atraurantiacus]|uniref:hypothetical protein n=1 Tax=Paractinoplanes atraurantiacus TaxID=1036182 RepID=UPI0015CF155D|nr:hypothetical protein [Actinoplanes atraurantiacus]